MKKIIKKWGSSFIIRISPDELKMFDLEVGDIVEIPDEALYRAGRGEQDTQVNNQGGLKNEKDKSRT